MGWTSEILTHQASKEVNNRCQREVPQEKGVIQTSLKSFWAETQQEAMAAALSGVAVRLQKHKNCNYFRNVLFCRVVITLGDQHRRCVCSLAYVAELSKS